MLVEKRAWWEKARAYAGGGVGAQARRRARKEGGLQVMLLDTARLPGQLIPQLR